MTIKTIINRPWISSFDFRPSVVSDKKLDQIHKLSRNFVSSLDLGCPSVSHVNLAGAEGSRELYKAWVKDWKKIYSELSRIIRILKQYRKTVNFPKPDQWMRDGWERESKNTNASLDAHVRELSRKHLLRLQETAQVLLNARYNAKLGAAELRRRALKLAEEQKLAA